ncbi:hypothetical protein D2N39_11660 [Gemmobacter lutimaris]|uniref:Tape measure protein N-terminal domain-containing protein n=1 Tax=Gemmobacter lutimaris TaxID=2306023 RepID=A0A398BN09_9RHOB|nr:tape measure protein [Gemmobacter lutimaris]RID91885.1 hypothetical protein D2N39_11660 [Gemmobacter lutimaris]
MARRDVEIKIRAKDDASKQARAISDALKQIEIDAKKAADGFRAIGNTDKNIGRISADIRKLETDAAKLKIFNEAATHIKASGDAVEKLSAKLSNNQTSFNRLRDEAAKSAAALKEMRDAQDALNQRLAAAKSRQAEIRTETKRHKDEVAAAKAAVDSYNAALAKTPNSGPAATSAGVFLRSAHKQAVADKSGYSAGVANESKALTAEVKSLNTAITTVTQRVNAAAKAHQGLETEVAKVGNATLSLRTDIRAENTALAALQNDLRAAGAGAATLSGKQIDLARDTAKATAELQRNQGVVAALGKYSNGSGGFAQPKVAEAMRKTAEAVAEQQRTAQAAKQEWKLLESEAARLGNALKTLSGNATEQVNAFKGIIAAAREAKKNYVEQQAAADRAAAAAARSAANLAASGNASTTAARNGAAAEGALNAARLRSTSSARDAAGATNQYTDSINRATQAKREAAGAASRLSAEISGLVTGYLSFNSAIGQVKESVTAFRSLESVQSRLGAVFAQDTARVAQEVLWLRNEAERLGIAFPTLAEQYGKFAIATQQAGFAQESVREMFISVAEAGRVNKLSVEQLGGTFTALEQIVSKGKFSAEEVRRQLGNRLPGAFSILANAIGKTTGELDKMMREGELFATEGNMLKFTREMANRFGPQLAASLNSLTTDIGRFENSVYNARIEMAKGFIPALREALQNFNAFASSADGKDLFRGVGEAVGAFANALVIAVQHIDLIAQAAAGLFAVGLGKFFLAITARVQGGIAALGGFTAQMVAGVAAVGHMSRAQRILFFAVNNTIGRLDALRARLAATAATSRGMALGTRALVGGLTLLRGAAVITAGAMRALWAAIGGLPGLVITGIITAVGAWITSVDDASAAIEMHNNLLTETQEAYNSAKTEAEGLRKVAQSISLPRALENLDTQSAAWEAAMKRMRGALYVLDDAISNFNVGTLIGNSDKARLKADAKAVREITAAFTGGGVSLEKFTETLNQVYSRTDNDFLKKLITNLLSIADGGGEAGQSMAEIRTRMEEAGGIVIALGGTISDTVKELLGFKTATDEANAALEDTKKATNYTDAINALKEKIPGLTDEMERLKRVTELNAAALTALVAAAKSGDWSKIKEVFGLWGQGFATIPDPMATARMEAEYVAGRGSATGQELGELVQATNTVAKQLGVSARDLLAVMSFETGGTLDKWKSGPTTKWGQHIGLIQWGEPQRAQYGVTEGMSVGAQVAAVGKYLIDHGVKPGDALPQIYAAVLAGDARKVDASDKAAGGVVDNVTDAVKGDLFKGHIDRAEALQRVYAYAATEGEALHEKAVEAAKLAKDQAEATAKRLADGAFELDQQGRINAGKEREAAIQAAIRDAKAENPKIGAKELEQVRAQAAALWDAQNASKGRQDAEERVNQLYDLRQSLLEQQQMMREQGDMTGAARLGETLQGVNQQLREAITNAIAMWTAIGGPEADAAIAKLETQRMSLSAGNDKIIAFGLNAQQFEGAVSSFADGLTGAFMSFAESLANGEKGFKALGTAFLKFASDFLIQIGQMIIKQAILNALAGISGPIGTAASALGGKATSAAPAWSGKAFVYHEGGIAGFKPGEIPAKLKRGEEILTEDNPRHIANVGAAQSNMSILNVFDTDSAAQAILSAPSADKLFVNKIRMLAPQIKKALV